jgi:hypothetical protein
MQHAAPAGLVAVPGLVDSHAHLLRDSAGLAFPATAAAVREFHHRVAADGSSPMDVLDPPPPVPPDQVAARLQAGLRRAAAAGLTEITEMGLREWWYLDALAGLQAAGRSVRDGFGTSRAAPPHSRLPAALAFGLLSDPAAGTTLLSADPRAVQPAAIDQIEVCGTAPAPFPS